MSAPVSSLFISLRRSLAGTRHSHRQLLKALGLKSREKVVERVNNAGVRNTLSQIKHLVSVETDEQFLARKAAEAAARAPRAPLTFQHSPVSRPRH